MTPRSQIIAFVYILTGLGVWPVVALGVAAIVGVSWCDKCSQDRRARREAVARRFRGVRSRPPARAAAAAGGGGEEGEGGEEDSLDALARELADIDREIDALTKEAKAAEAVDAQTPGLLKPKPSAT